jgi:hypothetical protein
LHKPARKPKRKRRRIDPTDLRAVAREIRRKAEQRAALPTKRLQHAARMLKRAQTRAALAQTIVKRWSRRVKVYTALLEKHQQRTSTGGSQQ